MIAKRWIGGLFYFISAIAVSTPFRFHWIPAYEAWRLPYGLGTFKFVLEGCGPVIGALLAWKWFPVSGFRPTLVGTSRLRSLAVSGLALVTLAAMGAPNELGVEPHLFALFLSLTIWLYCLAEEIGWRGYLLPALLPALAWTIVGGVLWFTWHLSFLRGHPSVRGQLSFLLILCFANWGIGMLALRTRSLLYCATLHMSVNVMAFDALAASVPIRLRIAAGAAMIVLCGAALLGWPRPAGKSELILEPVGLNENT